MTFSDKTYDMLKWIAMYLLPALGTLYGALGKIWNLPYATEIVGTICALDVFLGALLGISSHNYAGDGTLVVDKTDPDTDKYQYIVETPLDEVAEKGRIVLRVENKE